MQIRQITAEEQLATAFPLQAYAFTPSPPAGDDVGDFAGQLPYYGGNHTLVVEDDRGAPVATGGAIPMRQNLRGTVFPMAGIASVASHPLGRRQGRIRTLLIRLFGDMCDQGYPLATLYPFRPSFYHRFGFVGLPKPRTVTCSPAELAPLLRVELPGEVRWTRISQGYDDYRDLTLRLLGQRHGYAVFPDYRAVRLRDRDNRWLATAWVDGQVAGALTYHTTDHGGDLLADDMLATCPVSRALLLRFLAGHVDQVTRVMVGVDPAEMPELWLTDFAVTIEARLAFPTSAAPMGRVLSLTGLAGLGVGAGRVAVTVVDDPWLAGDYLLDGSTGTLEVTRGQAPGTGTPTATLTAPGLSGLVYGVLDPGDVVVRGLGGVPPDAATALRALFPRALPYLHAAF